jgi:hypothetical protein
MEHLNQQALKAMNKIDMHIPYNISNLPLCESCLFGKQHKIRFTKGLSAHAYTLLKLVHSDVYGPMQIKSIKIFKIYNNIFKNE